MICLPFIVQIWIYTITQQLKYLGIRSRSLYWVQLALQESSSMYINRIKGIDAQWIYFQLVFFDIMFSLNWISLYCFFMRCLLLCSRLIVYLGFLVFFPLSKSCKWAFCFIVPTSLLETCLLFGFCWGVRMLILMERHEVRASPFQFIARRSAESSAPGHKGLIFQWDSYFQGELPVLNTWCWWEQLFPRFSTHTHIHTHTYVCMYICWIGPLVCLHFVWEMELVIYNRSHSYGNGCM